MTRCFFKGMWLVWFRSGRKAHGDHITVQRRLRGSKGQSSYKHEHGAYAYPSRVSALECPGSTLSKVT